MCGRASLTASPEEIEEAFGLNEPPAVSPRYNIAPSEPMLIVRGTDAGGRQPAVVQWGLIRSGSVQAKPAINLRVEHAARGKLQNRRCIVPLTGFYEWKRAGKAKQPWNVRRRDGKVFGVAGLWDRREGGQADQLESCLLLTTEANSVVRPIHDRMPVILDPSSYSDWLDGATQTASQLLGSFQGLPEELLVSYPVSSLVNRAGVEDARCLDPAKSSTLW